jgi:DNA polymerase-3 subunit beta
MKVNCSKEKLEEAVFIAEKITGKNLTLPVLKGILLETENNSLKISSTNLDLGIEIKIPAKISKDGKVVVPGGILNNFLSNTQENEISLEQKKENLSISTKSNNTLIKTFPKEDFPSIPLIKDNEPIKIEARKFVDGLKSVWFSASNSSMKPELSSIYIHQKGGNIVFVATDSFRLAEKTITSKAKDFSSILIPVRNIGDIIRVLEGSGGEVEVSLNKNQVSFAFDNTYLTSRIIDGIFPDYKQIIPKETKTEAISLKEDLLNNLKIANIFSDKFNQTLFKIFPSKKKFILESKNLDIGENKGEVRASLEGDDIEIGFNYKYVMDAFQSINSDSISLALAGAGKPMIIKGVSDNTFLYIVMPMNR